VLSAFSINTEAASYRETLKKKGFTEPYLDDLVKLHQQHPKWEFVPMITGLDFNDAVNGERKVHSNQTVQKLSGRDSKYYCSCSKCFKNGQYVWCYGGVIAASRWAVAHYMNPLNWLDEKHIFQFEGNFYNKNQTQKGVESILKYSFMSDAYITYNNTEGKLVTYYDSSGKKVKYSKAILDVAKKYNLSPYLMASRTKKEVGGSLTRVASGVVGTKKPFVGMYNFFSVGAAMTGTQGLEFASGFMKSTKKCALYKKYNSSTNKASKKICTMPAAQRMSYIGSYGKYYKVRLYERGSGYSTDGKVGYVLKANTSNYPAYGRPWTDPYKSINGSGEFISTKFKYQYTDYLTKFNVNKDSGYLYAHEYMSLMEVITLDSETLYKAYKNVNVLDDAHTFYIPVYKNIPSDDDSYSQPSSGKPAKVGGLKVSARSVKTLTLSWNKAAGADRYYVYRYYPSTKKYKKIKTVTKTSVKLTDLNAGSKYYYCVAANNEKGTGERSVRLTAVTRPKTVTMTSLTSPGYSLLKSKWKKVDGKVTGYQIKYARDSKFKNTVATKDLDKSYKTYTGKNFQKGIQYYVRVRSYVEYSGVKYYGKYSKTFTVKCN
jgi:hypothetical protein